ncbi:MAG: sigma-54-dependent Fis family transcriptional regulator [Polyangiaceae bacterium]|nr:sigma-54-dependent Fis family transcriptional regulator [Polyangiaceae bacterium]
MPSKKHLLLTWSDAGTVGPKPAHHLPRAAADRGPIRRLLDHADVAYDLVRILTVPAGEGPARELAHSIETANRQAVVEVVDLNDPSNYAQLFTHVGAVSADVRRHFDSAQWNLDVLLSAGTPQAQTLWVILIQAGVLPARMLQVIPSVFVTPEQPPVRVVTLDIDGFPEIRALRREVHRLREQLGSGRTLMIGDSPEMREVVQRAHRIAPTDAPVLITGETGTGKEVLAREIHAWSNRAKGPFVAENCGVFAEGVLASELFGHEPGAFTGAVRRRKGVFEQAHGGTLLLDEVGELSPRVQAALLRVLQEHQIRRVGAETAISVNVRIIAATHRDLPEMVRAGTFREDLYFRLRGAVINLPPLRRRPGDLDLLMDAFLTEIANRRAEPRLVLSKAARRLVLAYSWPGNIRELRAEVERWAVFCERTVEEQDLSPELRGPPRQTPELPPVYTTESPTSKLPSSVRPSPPSTLSEAVEQAERAAITHAMETTSANLLACSRVLGIDRNTLKRKLAYYGIARKKADPKEPQ